MQTNSKAGGTQHVFATWTGDASGTAITSSITMNGAKTASANWNTQYLVSYSEAGNALPIALPSNEWVNAGASAKGTFAPEAVNSDNDTQCVFQSDNRTQSINQPTAIKGEYITQYKVTFNQTGLLSDAKGTILTILGFPEDYSKLSSITWVNNGTQITFSFNASVASTIANKLYSLTGVSAVSPVVINQPTLIQGSYKAEYTTTLYTVLEVALITLSLFIAAVLLQRYRSQRIRKQQNLNEAAANPSS